MMLPHLPPGPRLPARERCAVFRSPSKGFDPSLHFSATSRLRTPRMPHSSSGNCLFVASDENLVAPAPVLARYCAGDTAIGPKLSPRLQPRAPPPAPDGGAAAELVAGDCVDVVPHAPATVNSAMPSNPILVDHAMRGAV